MIVLVPCLFELVRGIVTSLWRRPQRVDPRIPVRLGSSSDENWGVSLTLQNGTKKRKSKLFEEYESIIKILKKYDFDFENLAFEGGGNKGIAYGGAVKILEKIGVLWKCKRFAGSSAGAAVALLVALGYSGDEIIFMMKRDISAENFMDSRSGRLGLLYNLFYHHGWHPGKKLHQTLESYVEQATGRPHLTFEELYQEYDKELCVVCTNITTMSAEYFHPKTTPDVSIALAVRMSMSLPGVFQPVKLERHGTTYVYVDGGLLCNYPVHVFDGWFLSMKPKDSFLKRLDISTKHKATNQHFMFGGHNTKTLGMMLYSGNEVEFMKNQFENRLTKLDDDGKAEFYFENPRPDTKLAKLNGPIVDQYLKTERKRNRIFEAAMHFWQALRECDKDGNDAIDKDELRKALQNGIFTEHDATVLFGKSYSVDQIFQDMDTNKDGSINWQEFLYFIERRSVAFMCYVQKLSMRDVNTFGDFLTSVLDTVEINVKQLYMKTNDDERTIGINTDYVQTTDFYMETEDKEFLIRQGAIACIQYLKGYIEKNYGETISYQLVT